MNALNVTELSTLKWLILCYVNFTAISKVPESLQKKIDMANSVTYMHQDVE